MASARMLGRLELATTTTKAALAEALCLLLCQERGALVVEFSLGALGDEFLGTSCNLLYKRLHIVFRGRWHGAKHDLSVVVLGEDAIGQDIVKVAIEIEKRAKALHKADGTAHGICDAEASCGALLPGEHFAQGHVEYAA